MDDGQKVLCGVVELFWENCRVQSMLQLCDSESASALAVLLEAVSILVDVACIFLFIWAWLSAVPLVLFLTLSVV